LFYQVILSALPGKTRFFVSVQRFACGTGTGSSLTYFNKPVVTMQGVLGGDYWHKARGLSPAM